LHETGHSAAVSSERGKAKGEGALLGAGLLARRGSLTPPKRPTEGLYSHERGCSGWSRPMLVCPFGRHTTDRIAGCGRSARPVGTGARPG